MLAPGAHVHCTCFVKKHNTLINTHAPTLQNPPAFIDGGRHGGDAGVDRIHARVDVGEQGGDLLGAVPDRERGIPKVWDLVVRVHDALHHAPNGHAHRAQTDEEGDHRENDGVPGQPPARPRPGVHGRWGFQIEGVLGIVRVLRPPHLSLLAKSARLDADLRESTGGGAG